MALTLMEFDKWCREFLDKNFDPKDKINSADLKKTDDMVDSGDDGEIVVRVTNNFDSEVIRSTVPLVQPRGMPPVGPSVIDHATTSPKALVVMKYEKFFASLPTIRIGQNEIQMVTKFMSMMPRGGHFAKDLQRIDRIKCYASKITLADIDYNEPVKVISGTMKDVRGKVYHFDPDRQDDTVWIQNGWSIIEVRVAEIERDMTLHMAGLGGKQDQWGAQQGTVQAFQLGYNPEFIARSVFEDYLACYAGCLGYEEYGRWKGQIDPGRGAYTSFAYLVGHELMHYRYGHLLSNVSAALKEIVMPNMIKEYIDDFNKEQYVRIANHRIYMLSEIQNNTYMSRILNTPVVNGGLGPQTPKMADLWGWGYLLLKSIKTDEVKPSVSLPIFLQMLASRGNDSQAEQDLEALKAGSLTVEPAPKKRTRKKKVAEAVDLLNVPPEMMTNLLPEVQDYIKSRVKNNQPLDLPAVEHINKRSAPVPVWDLTLAWKRQNLRSDKDCRHVSGYETKVTHPKDKKKVAVQSVVITGMPLSIMSCQEAGLIYCTVLGLFTKVEDKDDPRSISKTHPKQKSGDKKDKFDEDELLPPPPPPPPPPNPPDDDGPDVEGYQMGDIVRVNADVVIPGRDPKEGRDGIVIEAKTNPDRTQTLTILVDNGAVMKACRHKNPVADPNPVKVTLNSNQITLSPNQPLQSTQVTTPTNKPKPKSKFRTGMVVKNKAGVQGVIVGIALDIEGNETLKVDTDPKSVEQALSVALGGA